MITTGTKSVLTRTDSFLNKLNPKTIMAELTGRSIPAPKKLKLLTLDDYKQDIRARWLILQRELYELGIDIKRFINFVTPMVRGIVDKLKSLFSKEKT
tara:strand:+ start:327 stop:620 length:294 start_codon:yes stop_codon:yes gene_type:complete